MANLHDNLKTNMAAIVNKAYSKIRILRRISFLRSSTLESIYFLTVLSSMLYGVSIVVASGSHRFKDLEAIHTRTTRLIHKHQEI